MNIKTRKRWTSDRPIVCQADMDDAVAVAEMIERDIATICTHPYEIQGARLMLKKVKARIAEREENTI